MLIDQQDEKLQLGVPQMDETHREFADLVNRLDQVDKTGFIELFQLLETHTQAHFDSEDSLMKDSDFPALREHQDEHRRVLGELRRIGERVRRGSIAMARAYVREQLPQWFALHAATMDSALAAHLKYRAQQLRFVSATLH